MSRRTPGRRNRGYRPAVNLGSIHHEGIGNMGLCDSVDSFFAGTYPPSIRPSPQTTPKRNNDTPRGRVTSPTQSKSTTEGRSDDDDTTHTRTNAASSTNNSRTHTASNRSCNDKSTDAKATGISISIVTNGFVLSEYHEEKIEELGGDVVSFDESQPKSLVWMSVLIASADSSTTPVNPHTTPFIFALTRGIPIVVSGWLKKSLKEGEFLPMDGYLLKNDEAGEIIDTSGAMGTHFPVRQSIGNGIEALRDGGILSNYMFTLCVGIGEGTNEPSMKELNVLLQAAGAKRLTRKDLEGEDMDDLSKLLLVTSSPATDKQVEQANKFVGIGAIRVQVRLMLQVLLQQSLAPLERVIAIQAQRAADAEKQASANADAAFHTFAGNPERVVHETTLVDASRTLSKPKVGNLNRGQLGGGGTLQILEDAFNNKGVKYYDQKRILRFKASVPSKSDAHKEMFGNAGLQDMLVWETTDKSGYGSGSAINRRFCFVCKSRAQLDTILAIMFGLETDPSTNQSILEEWYDEEGRFYGNEVSLPAHVIVSDGNEMEDDLPKRAAAKPRAVGIAENGNDPLAESQLPFG